MIQASEEQITLMLERGVAKVIDKDHLKKRLLSSNPLRVKFGIDPTSPDLHLGHAVALRKLREFQDLGHKIVLVVGDFTAKIGDPSGRDKTRPTLSEEEIKKNYKTYLDQAEKIINVGKGEVAYNSKWFRGHSFWSHQDTGVQTVLNVAHGTAVAHILKRDDFEKRLKEGKEITVLEILYPVFQGYDSVEVRADVEIGGTDQEFNLLEGRRIQRQYNMSEQDVVMVPLLEGLDGVKKMSKSYGNYIGLGDSADDMFGKTMSLPDALIGKYFILCTSVTKDEMDSIAALPPRDQKVRLGFEIVKLYHGEENAKRAKERFEKLFSKKEIPEDIAELRMNEGSTVLDLVIQSGAAESKSEGRRLIEQGAVEIDSVRKTNPMEKVRIVGGEVLKVGKHRFFRLKK